MCIKEQTTTKNDRLSLIAHFNPPNYSGGSRPSDKAGGGGGEGGGQPDPEISGGPGLQKKFFLLFGPHFGLKIRGGGLP